MTNCVCYNELLFDERYALQTHCKLLVSVNGDNQEAAMAMVRSIFLHQFLSERISVNEEHHFVGMFI